MSQIISFRQVAGPGSGTVTSISAGTGITLTPNPITTTGTVALTIPVVVSSGGTGAITLTNHGVLLGQGTNPIVATAVGTTGQVLTGVTGADPVWASPAASSITLTGDTGGPLVGNSFTITGGTSGAIFAGAGTTLTESFNFLALPDTDTGGTVGYIKFGANTIIQDYPTGSGNFIAGFLAGNTSVTLTGGANNGIGGGVFSMLTSGAENSGFGHTTLQTIKTGSRNSAFGESALNGMDSGNNNVAVGYEAAWVVSTGSNNTALGQLAGSAWTGANSNNIAINNIGIAGDSGKIRIGTNGTHTATFIAGIDGVNVGSVAKVVTMASDQLGTATITAGTNVTITPGANTITIAANATSATFNYVSVNNAASPYTALATDYYISADVTAGVISILLPNAPTTGRVFVVKDKVGLAATSNITVTTVGGAVNIDGATSFVMNTAYESIQLIFNGTSYEVY